MSSLALLLIAGLTKPVPSPTANTPDPATSRTWGQAAQAELCRAEVERVQHGPLARNPLFSGPPQTSWYLLTDLWNLLTLNVTCLFYLFLKQCLLFAFTLLQCQSFRHWCELLCLEEHIPAWESICTGVDLALLQLFSPGPCFTSSI